MNLTQLVALVILLAPQSEAFRSHISGLRFAASPPRQHLVTFNTTRQRHRDRQHRIEIGRRQYSKIAGKGLEINRRKYIKTHRYSSSRYPKTDPTVDAWEKTCAAEEKKVTKEYSKAAFWNQDLYSLQACDVLRSSNMTTTPRLAKIIAKTFDYTKKSKKNQQKDAESFCDVDSSNENDKDLISSSVFCSGGMSIDIQSAALPFCNHFTMWQVIQSNPEISRKCDGHFSNFTACQSCASEILRLDKLARLGYCSLEGILKQADCQIPYSPTIASCSTCKQAYRYWLCGQLFQQIRFTDKQLRQSTTTSATPANKVEDVLNNAVSYPCPSLCHNVMKMCPFTNPIWDDEVVIYMHGKKLQLEPVEYAGWAAFHCPDRLSPNVANSKICYSFVESSENPGEPNLEFQTIETSSAISIQKSTCFQNPLVAVSITIFVLDLRHVLQHQ